VACRTVRAIHHYGNMSAVQWGTVATWVAGVGTVVAVSLALWEARAERKERLRRELRQQAVRISAWFVGMHKEPHDEDPHHEDPRRDARLPPELRGRAADVELSRMVVIISFTDSAGNHWARGARGELRQLRTAAIEYWKVRQEDVDWRVPTRLD
jgi:hypothetical protein